MQISLISPLGSSFKHWLTLGWKISYSSYSQWYLFYWGISIVWVSGYLSSTLFSPQGVQLPSALLQWAAFNFYTDSQSDGWDADKWDLCQDGLSRNKKIEARMLNGMKPPHRRTFISRCSLCRGVCACICIRFYNSVEDLGERMKALRRAQQIPVYLFTVVPALQRLHVCVYPYVT